MDQEQEKVGLGIYTLPETARLLKVSHPTLRRWANGYTFACRGGRAFSGPVVERESAQESLTFAELVELWYVKEFRRRGVPLPKLRAASARLRTLWDMRYPFASKRVLADGPRLLIQEVNGWQDASTGQITEVFEFFLERISFSGDFAIGFAPLGLDRSVLLDPARRFGQPIDRRSGVPTQVLFSAYRANGEDPLVVAHWLDLSVQSVLDAVEFERDQAGGLDGVLA